MGSHSNEWFVVHGWTGRCDNGQVHLSRRTKARKQTNIGRITKTLALNWIKIVSEMVQNNFKQILKTSYYFLHSLQLSIYNWLQSSTVIVLENVTDCPVLTGIVVHHETIFNFNCIDRIAVVALRRCVRIIKSDGNVVLGLLFVCSSSSQQTHRQQQQCNQANGTDSKSNKQPRKLFATWSLLSNCGRAKYVYWRRINIFLRRQRIWTVIRSWRNDDLQSRCACCNQRRLSWIGGCCCFASRQIWWQWRLQCRR